MIKKDLCDWVPCWLNRPPGNKRIFITGVVLSSGRRKPRLRCRKKKEVRTKRKMACRIITNSCNSKLFPKYNLPSHTNQFRYRSYKSFPILQICGYAVLVRNFSFLGNRISTVTISTIEIAVVATTLIRKETKVPKSSHCKKVSQVWCRKVRISA